MEREVFRIILEQREEEHKAGRNVTMYQHCNVGSTRRGSQKVTNVATPQRRDVATLRRLNVATLQRCDVSAISASTSLKEKGPEIERGWENA